MAGKKDRIKSLILQERQPIVVIVPYSAYPAEMGGRRSIAAFNEMLNKYFKVQLVTTKNSAIPPGDIILHPLLEDVRSRYFDLSLFARIIQLMDSLHTNKLVMIQPYFGWLALMLKFFSRRKYFVKAENIEAARFKELGKWWWPLMKIYEGLTLRSAGGIFFITGEDRLSAIKSYRLQPGRCHVFPYGTNRSASPPVAEKMQSRAQLEKKFEIQANEKILLFNGSLDYPPNLNALQVILNDLLPVWLNAGFQFRVIICGSNLPEGYKNLDDFRGKKVHYAGFVGDIESYFLGSDIFLNPVWQGGGIKTKLIDAIALGCTAVSTVSGAMGVPDNLAAEKLVVVEDKDWQAFANAVMEVKDQTSTPPEFYKYFNYDENIRRVAAVIQSVFAE